MDAVDSAAQVDVTAAAPASESKRLDAFAVALACLALAAALAARDLLPAWSLPWCAGIAVFATAALPLLVRWSPTPPDPLELAVFTLALSPVLSASVWAAWHSVLDGRDALAATAAGVGVAHLASLRTTVRAACWSRAQLAVLALAILLVLAASLLLLRGSEARLDDPALTRAALAMAVDRSLPPLHPWLAGEPWRQVFSADLLAAFSMGALAIAPTVAHALFAILALGLTPVLLFFLSTAIWSDSLRSLISVALALCAGIIAFRGDASGHAALEPFLDPGPSALALMLSLAALACAAHALRHGRRPWVGMCALFHGFALLLEFSSAWPAAAATVLAALSPWCDARCRPRLLLALTLASLPGLAQARWFDPALLPIPPQAFGASIAHSLALGILSVLGCVLAWRATAPNRRVVVVLCAIAALIASAGALSGSAWTNPRTAWSLALVCGAVPAAALFGVSPPVLGRLRWSGAFACVALGLSGPVLLGERAVGSWAKAQRDDPLLGETARALEPIGSEASALDLRAALASLRQDARLLADRAVLLACPAHNPYRKTRDLPELGLGACANVALYGDAGRGLLGREPQYLPRLEELLLLFRDPGDFDPTLFARLEHSGVKTVIALVRDEDRAIQPALVGKLERLGFARWREFGGVWLYVGPREAARRYLGTP